VATYRAIAATSDTILGLLNEACPRPEFAGARFELYQVGDFQSPMDLGISLHLYRVAVNRTRRVLPGRPAPDGQRYRDPLSVDVYYLLSAWAKTAATQQRLLGWAMRALEDAGILPAGLLNYFGPERTTFRADETVELVAEALAFADLTRFWDLFKPNMPLSTTYIARLIGLDSTVPIVEAGPVQIREFQVQKVID
jgi:hypothetical protein